MRSTYTNTGNTRYKLPKPQPLQPVDYDNANTPPTLPGDLPTPPSDRAAAEVLRSVQQPQRMLAKWLREKMDTGAIQPGGKVMVMTAGGKK